MALTGHRQAVWFGCAACLALALGGCAARAQAIQGTATYRERIALPPAAVFEATLEDVSRADAPAGIIGRTRVQAPGAPPIAFTIPYDPAAIESTRQYVVRARILVDGALMFTSDTATPVLTRGGADSVSLVLRRMSGVERSPTPVADRPLEGTYWRAVELAGTPAPAQDEAREAHLLFQADGRVSGSDGCNRLLGSYVRSGDRLTFGQLAGTQMACLDAAGIERPFRAALTRTARVTVAGERLELLDAMGTSLAAFEARADRPDDAGATALEGTSWRLVEFQGGDDTTLTPDDRSRYTLAFAPGGRLNVRIDCNRGQGTWTSSGPSQLQFGPLALTRAACPPGSLHDRIVKQWPFIRSYVIRDGHLFLSLMADGGIYEFEPFDGTP